MATMYYKDAFEELGELPDAIFDRLKEVSIGMGVPEGHGTVIRQFAELNNPFHNSKFIHVDAGYKKINGRVRYVLFGIAVYEDREEYEASISVIKILQMIEKFTGEKFMVQHYIRTYHEEEVDEFFRDLNTGQ